MIPQIKIETWNDDGDEIVLAIPGKRVICPRCDGTGVHDHPAFSNGISSEEFDEDPDFRESYFRGHFDVPCEECRGEKVIVVADEERCTATDLEAYHAELESHRPCAIQEMERRMGA